MHVKYYNLHISECILTYLISGINIVKDVVWGIILCELQATHEGLKMQYLQ